jgi:hypothetical protein
MTTDCFSDTVSYSGIDDARLCSGNDCKAITLSIPKIETQINQRKERSFFTRVGDGEAQMRASLLPLSQPRLLKLQALHQSAIIEALRLQRIKRRWNVPYTSSPDAVEA